MIAALEVGAESVVALDSIRIEGRHRKELRNIEGLAESIAEIGLIQPVTVDSDYRLIGGERRIAAHRLLGLTQIQVYVASQFDDARLALLAERDENVCREDMTPEELVDLGFALEKMERPKADDRQSEGRKAGAAVTNAGRWGVASGPGGPEATNAYAPGVTNAGQTSAIVGEAIGISRNTYNRAKHVVRTARGDSESTPEIQEVAQEALEAMNSGTMTITGAYNAVRKARQPATKPKAPPKFGGGRRKHSAQLVPMLTALDGYAVMIAEIKDSGLDGSVEKAEAARLADGLGKSIASLHAIKTLLEERSK